VSLKVITKEKIIPVKVTVLDIGYDPENVFFSGPGRR
jgi:hypothetical protein